MPYISCVRFTSKVLWCISSNHCEPLARLAQRMARHKVQRVRYHKYKDLAFDLDFCSGPAEILAGGMGVRKQDRASTNEEPLTAFVGTKGEMES